LNNRPHRRPQFDILGDRRNRDQQRKTDDYL